MKAAGCPAVEIPITGANKPIYRDIGKVLKDQGLDYTAMFNLGADRNLISANMALRGKAVDELKGAIDTSRVLNSQALVGLYYSAYAAFSGTCPTEGELL